MSALQPPGSGYTVDLSFHGGPAEMPQAARLAEAHGAARHSGGLFVSEANHDPFVSLAAAAVSTSGLTLGTSVAIAFARTPMSLAYAAHDLQSLSGGRFVLGLGTQIAPHVTRRYGMPWSRPAARMKEYVSALHAIWDSWQTGERLAFEGDFYTHTLMPKPFSPGPLDSARPRIWVAGVGPQMLRVAAEVADGLVIHPLTHPAYLDEVIRPTVSAARGEFGATESFDLSAMVLVASGTSEEDLAAATELTRLQIGFYASTPAYLPVLEHAGFGALHSEARDFVARGAYSEIGSLIDDEILAAFAVVGEPEQVAKELTARYADRVDRVTMTMPFQPLVEGAPALGILDALH
jgi:probable F420-dependent oxidoreductase